MRKIIFTILIMTSFATIAADHCSFNFKDFHSLLDQKSKKYKSIKPETKDEISKTITQQAKLRSGEDLLFIGGGCAHVSYSFIFSKIKFKTKKIQDKFQKSHDLLAYIDIQKGSKDVLIEALNKAIKNPIKKSKTGIYDLPCGDAICNLDLSSTKLLKINYSFAL